jgi:hypothetical protein
MPYSAREREVRRHRYRKHASHAGEVQTAGLVRSQANQINIAALDCLADKPIKLRDPAQ